jgi:hypothetical protein
MDVIVVVDEFLAQLRKRSADKRQLAPGWQWTALSLFQLVKVCTLPSYTAQLVPLYICFNREYVLTLASCCAFQKYPGGLTREIIFTELCNEWDYCVRAAKSKIVSVDAFLDKSNTDRLAGFKADVWNVRAQAARFHTFTFLCCSRNKNCTSHAAYAFNVISLPCRLACAASACRCPPSRWAGLSRTGPCSSSRTQNMRGMYSRRRIC